MNITTTNIEAEISPVDGQPVLTAASKKYVLDTTSAIDASLSGGRVWIVYSHSPWIKLDWTVRVLETA